MSHDGEAEVWRAGFDVDVGSGCLGVEVEREEGVGREH